MQKAWKNCRKNTTFCLGIWNDWASYWENFAGTEYQENDGQKSKWKLVETLNYMEEGAIFIYARLTKKDSAD